MVRWKCRNKNDGVIKRSDQFNSIHVCSQTNKNDEDIHRTYIGKQNQRKRELKRDPQSQLIINLNRCCENRLRCISVCVVCIWWIFKFKQTINGIINGINCPITCGANISTWNRHFAHCPMFGARLVGWLIGWLSTRHSNEHFWTTN